MLSVDEALERVLDSTRPLAPRPAALEDALDLMLAEDVTSEIDSPPHDKSIVDGYAVIAAVAHSSAATFAVLEEVTAGRVPTKRVEPGTATRIMTGAPLPPGADAVVMVEKTRLAAEGDGERVEILETPVRPGQNIARRASSLQRGQVVLRAGTRLRGIELGLLAEVGRARVQAIPRPRVAIIATGDELVDAGETPGPGQIRNSNGPLLVGLATQAGAAARFVGIARDSAASLREHIGAALESDLVVLSGGVSAGVLDLVPQVLAELGVQQVFHKVSVKPGKPLWFGVRQNGGDRPPTLVFGLPGNPVSSLVSFELFVHPAIQKLSGREAAGLARQSAILTQEHKQRGDRPTYWPAVVATSGGETSVTPLAWKGSGDLRTLTDANALACFPSGDRQFEVGETIDVLCLP
jgi:molybdopterin molybdotransferase